MTDWGAHVAVIERFGYDPIVILLIVRMFLSAVIAILFFIEPRKCGGSNRMVHWLLATVFTIGAWSAWQRASARMLAISQATGALPAGSMILSEVAIVTAEVILIATLIYQEFNSKVKEEYNLADARCQRCEYEDACERRLHAIDGRSV